MAAKYIVKVLRVQGIGKRTYVAGDTVYDYNFPGDNAKKLADAGYLEQVKLSKAELKAEEQAKKEAEEKEKLAQQKTETENKE